MLPNCRTRLQHAALLLAPLLPLLTLSCGGKDALRPMGDSPDITDAAPLVGCDAEAALAAKLLLTNADFDSGSGGGWQTSVDSSPKPADGPRPIKSCPEDSTFDCCLYDTNAGLETELEATYKCALKDAPNCKGFSGSVAPQAIATSEEHACSGGGGAHGGALHLRAARFTDWGAQLYQSFSPPKDASLYDGISFWVKRGKGGSGAQPVGQTLFVVFDDKFTKENQPKFEIEVDPTNGDYVMETDPTTWLMVPKYVLGEDGNPKPVLTAATQDLPKDQQIQAQTCYDVAVDTMKCDRYGAGVGLSPEWRFVKIPFDSLRQRGYGVKSPAGRVLKEELLAFGVYMDVGNWDFWIDQVAFYSDPKPQ